MCQLFAAPRQDDEEAVQIRGVLHGCFFDIRARGLHAGTYLQLQTGMAYSRCSFVCLETVADVTCNGRLRLHGIRTSRVHVCRLDQQTIASLVSRFYAI